MISWDNGGTFTPRKLTVYPCHPSPSNRLLQQGNETTNNGQTKYGRVDGNAGSGVVIVTAAAATSSVAAGVLVGVLVVALATEGALNLAAATLAARGKGLEVIAGLVDVVGAGDVEGTANVLESREAHAMEC